MPDVYVPISTDAVERYQDTGAVTGDGRVIVARVVSSGSGSAVLPPDAATATNQVTANNFLSPINSNVGNIKDNVANVLPFIGLDTTAIRAQLPASLGAKTAANSLAVTLATDGVGGNILTRIGEIQASPTANTVLDRLKTIGDKLPTLGSQASSVSLSVTPASNATFTLSAESGYLTVRTQALTSTAQTIKTSSGSVMGWNFINVNSMAVYVKFYNALIANVTVGTTTPILTVAVPAGSSTNPGINMVTPDLVPFEVFSTAISFACVTGLADNSNTAPTTAIHASVRYK